MRILHIGLFSHFTNNMSYQDNCLAYQNAKDGHDVLYVSDNFAHENGVLTEVSPGMSEIEGGGVLLRVALKKIRPNLLTSKIGKVNKLYRIIGDFNPDVVLYHGCCGIELKTVAKYKINNPEIELFLDSHEAFHNSGTNWLSLTILHKVLHKSWVQYALPYVEKVLCVGMDSEIFVKDVYGVPSEMIERYPLGGFPIKADWEEKMRIKVRDELGFSQNDILVMHSGKMGWGKKTADLLKAFGQIDDSRLKLIIAGSIEDDTIKRILDDAIEADSRVRYLGWITADRLKEYLAASDIYCQPGTVSATAQIAACSHCALVLYPHEAYEDLFGNSVLYADCVQRIRTCIMELLNESYLEEMKEASFSLAKKELDYAVLASRLY